MWYGFLPSAAVIFASMSLPHVCVYFTNLLAFGNPYKRYLSNRYEWHTYLRDKRLGNGDPYNQLGLDCLCPDDKDKDKDITDEKCECP